MRKFEKVKRVEGIDFELPKRATKHSMAYDFYSPEDFKVESKGTYFLKTGVKANMNRDEGLILNPRSSMGKKNIMFANTNGWIDSDFYNNEENEGEIGLLFYNFGNETWEVKRNDRIAQGMFIKYLMTDDDETTNIRKGGWGSTNG